MKPDFSAFWTLFAGVLLGLMTVLAGCADEPLPCNPTSLRAQNHARFPVGETYWLPGGTEACAGLAWTVASRPPESEAQVVKGADGYSRITPQTTGKWTFKASIGGQTRTLNVVAASERPFHNLNYYPSGGLAKVGDKVWAVSTLRHEVVVLDAATMATEATVTVGSWPVALGVGAGGKEVLVAQRGSDTVGVIDVATRRLVDAIWVGDEPSNLVMSTDGKTAFVALATEAAVAVVDVQKRAVSARWQGPIDPLGVALSPDGAVLAVAAHRSGHTDRYPWGTDPKEDEKDIALIDTKTGKVTRWLIDVGTTINALHFGDGGQTLYAALLRNDIQANLANPDDPSFVHAVVAFAVATGKETAAVDLLRQKGSGGHAVSLHGLTGVGGELWVAAEASDIAVVLDATTLAEKRRITVPGRPRSLLMGAGGAWALGGQALAVHWLSDSKKAEKTGVLGVDPRPLEMAAGQRYFTGAGKQYGENWSCNSCHTDGLTDTLTWNAGPFASRLVTRPFFWLEGTWPLGWQGYLSSIRNYAFTVNTNIGIRPTTDEAENLYAYLASLMPPPAANGKTDRDGGHSKQALVGKKLYEGKAQCAGCHQLPMTSNRLRIEKSITEGPADVPALVGNYRQGVWLKHGEARTLQAGVEAALTWSKRTLTKAEVSDLTRYIEELTDREFFVLASRPRATDEAIAADRPVVLTMNRPVWNDAANLAAITLVDAQKTPVEVDVTADGAKVTVKPLKPLKFGQKYTLSVAGTLRSWDDTAMFGKWSLTLKVQAQPKLKLAGDYRWTASMPAPKPDFSGFNKDVTAPTTVVMYTTTRASGADVAVDYAEGLVHQAQLRIDGEELILPPLPVPVGPSFADTFGSRAKLTDADGDGVADGAQGELTIAGPGFEESGIKWTLSRPPPVDGCEVGPVDKANIAVTVDDKGRPVVTWDDGKTNALGVYVTDVGANLPFGPGQKVTGGKTYWATTATKFPTGFPGPVTYGVVPDLAIDASAEHGGTAGGAALAKGKCLQFGVITSKFQVLLYYRSL